MSQTFRTRAALALLVVAASGCNEEIIDPSDTRVLDVRDADASDLGDVDSDTSGPSGSPRLIVESVSRPAPTSLSARVCLIRGTSGTSGTSATSGAALDAATVTARFGDRTATLGAITASADRDCLDVSATSLSPGKHSLRASAADLSAAAAPDLWLPLWVEARPFDWREAILYMAMPDRFRDSDGSASPESGAPTIANYQGGDLPGLTSAITDGTFSALGVDALWLTPVVDNPPGAFVGLDGVHQYAGYHGYWPTDPFRLDEHLGTASKPAADAFTELVAAAHRAGIRIVMDTVLNHVHETHTYCTDRPAMCRRTCVCGTAGCDWEARALDCQFASYLPDLDYTDPETLSRVVDDLFAFIAVYDLDGLRLDAVKHVDKAVLRAIRARVDAIQAAGGAPIWLVGETFTGSDGRDFVNSFLGPELLDGQFDFPLYWTIHDTFVNGGSFRNLEAAVAASEATYGDALGWMSPFLGNHDVERMATALAKNDLGPWGGTIDLLAQTVGETPQRWDIINPMSMAMAFLLTARGVPLLYMGDELGLGGSNDPDNRRLLPTTLTADQRELQRRVRELGAARRANPVLARGARRELWQDETIYVQARWWSTVPAATEPGAKVVLVAMNKGDSRAVTVTLPPELAASGKRFTSLLSDKTYQAQGDQLTLPLDNWEYVLLTPAP